MSARSDNERLREENEQLRADLAEAREDAAAHMANVQRLTPKAGRAEEAEAALILAHENRVEAWKQVGALKQQLADRDITLRGLTEERDAAVAAVEAMQVEDMEAGFTS